VPVSARYSVQRAALAIAVLAIAIGIFARFDRLDRKLFFQDEAFSLLRLSGHTLGDYEKLFDGKVRTAGAIAEVMRVTPQHGLGDAFSSIVREEPQRGPLFYLAARLWIDAFGESIAAMRAFPAMLGVLGIGLAYLLGARLGRAPPLGIILAAFVAVSPFHIRYSQQLREYVLVADLTFLSTWLLLRALDRPGWVRWSSYAISLIFSFYASVELVLLALAHGLFVWVTTRASGKRPLAQFALVALAAGLAYAPLVLAELGGRHWAQNGVSWEITAYPLSSFLIKWAFNFGAVFYDHEFAGVRWAVLLVPVLLIEAYAYVRVLGGAWVDGQIRVLGLALTAAALIPLVVLDLILRARFEAATRYQVTTWIGAELVVAGVIASALASQESRARTWSLVALTYLLACGAFAAFADRSYVVWWDNNEHISEKAVAAIVSQDRHALVIADDNDYQSTEILVLCRYLAPSTDVMLFHGPLPNVTVGREPVYLFLPTAAVRRQLLRGLDAGLGLKNVSPDIGIDIPDLRPPASAPRTVEPGNALWRVMFAPEHDFLKRLRS